MQRVCEKRYHKWTPDEKFELRCCSGERAIRRIANKIKLPYETVYATWKHLHEEKHTDMAQFDYSLMKPLKSLFTRCPVCGGSTGVNKSAYCHSCLSQWNPITLEPMKGLHEADPVN
jgi:hypothetical protein